MNFTQFIQKLEQAGYKVKSKDDLDTWKYVWGNRDNPEALKGAILLG